jgi:hypothetical protein
VTEVMVRFGAFEQLDNAVAVAGNGLTRKPDRRGEKRVIQHNYDMSTHPRGPRAPALPDERAAA